MFYATLQYGIGGGLTLLQPSVKKSKTLFTGPYFRKLVLMLFYYFGFLIGAEPEAAGL